MSTPTGATTFLGTPWCTALSPRTRIFPETERTSTYMDTALSPGTEYLILTTLQTPRRIFGNLGPLESKVSWVSFNVLTTHYNVSSDPYNVTIEGITIANSAAHSVSLAIGYKEAAPELNLLIAINDISWLNISF